MKVLRNVLVLAPWIAAVGFAQNSGGRDPSVGFTPVVSPPTPVQQAVSADPTKVVATPISAVSPDLIAVAATPAIPVPPRILPVGTTEQPSRTGETSINLDVGFGIRAVSPSRVTVPVGEKVRLVAAQLAPADGQYIWTRNGQAIAGANASVLVLDHVTSNDAGIYAWMYATPTSLPRPSQQLILGVGQTNRLLNVSVRGTLAAGAGQSFTAGFIVGGGPQPKKIVVRAIGPTLAQFGVTNAIQRPVLRIFDSAGKEYVNGYAYPAASLTYESDLADSLASVGAFPTPAGSSDAAVLLPFAAGAYTAQVTNADGSAGEVLVEIYEVP